MCRLLPSTTSGWQKRHWSQCCPRLLTSPSMAPSRKSTPPPPSLQRVWILESGKDDLNLKFFHLLVCGLWISYPSSFNFPFLCVYEIEIFLLPGLIGYFHKIWYVYMARGHPSIQVTFLPILLWLLCPGLAKVNEFDFCEQHHANSEEL